jgi:iron(III) transport system substrate-binding protein
MKQFFSLIVFIALTQPIAVWSQGFKPNSIADLALYSVADREQMLAAGAKKEGKLVWYTALAGGSYKDLAQAFQAKYGVQVESYRGTSKDLISKFLAEAQAKKYLMDVAESSLPLLMLMQALKLMQPFANPYVAKPIPDAREEAGKGAVFWATVRESYIVDLAYNKNKLPANAVPKNYDDLLKPRLKDGCRL